MDIQDIIQYCIHTRYNTNPNDLASMLTALGITGDANKEIIEYAIKNRYNINPNDLATMLINAAIGPNDEDEESEEESSPAILK